MPTATIAFTRRPQHPMVRQGKLTRYFCRNLYVFEKNFPVIKIGNRVKSETCELTRMMLDAYIEPG